MRLEKLELLKSIPTANCENIDTKKSFSQENSKNTQATPQPQQVFKRPILRSHYINK